MHIAVGSRVKKCANGALEPRVQKCWGYKPYNIGRDYMRNRIVGMHTEVLAYVASVFWGQAISGPEHASGIVKSLAIEPWSYVELNSASRTKLQAPSNKLDKILIIG